MLYKLINVYGILIILNYFYSCNINLLILKMILSEKRLRDLTKLEL